MSSRNIKQKRAREDDDDDDDKQDDKRPATEIEQLTEELTKRIGYLNHSVSSVTSAVRYVEEIGANLKEKVDQSEQIDAGTRWLHQARKEALIEFFEQTCSHTDFPRCSIIGCKVVVKPTDKHRRCANKHRICLVCTEYLTDYPAVPLVCAHCTKPVKNSTLLPQEKQ